MFQISITSASHTLLYHVCPASSHTLWFKSVTDLEIFLTDNWEFRPNMRIILTLYGIFNLDFYRYNVLQPYCLSSKFNFIHTAFFGYIPAFYPILLIFLTWVCVELHGRNFRPLVWLLETIPQMLCSTSKRLGHKEWHHWCVHYISYSIIL